MEAQRFFEMCNSTIKSCENVPLHTMELFGNVDKLPQNNREGMLERFTEQEFLDNTGDGVLQEASNCFEMVEKIANVSIAKIPQSTEDPDLLYDFYFSFLRDDQRIVIESDIISTWNSNFVQQFKREEDVLHEFILMLFGIDILNAKLLELKKLPIYQLQALSPLPLPVNLSDLDFLYEQVSKGVNLWEFQILASYVGTQKATSVVLLPNFKYDEAYVFCKNKDVFACYEEVMRGKDFDFACFSLIAANNSVDKIVELYHNDLSYLLKLVSHREQSVIRAMCRAIESNVVTEEWVEKYKDAERLCDMLKARINFCENSSIELELDEKPPWFMQLYVEGKFKKMEPGQDVYLYLLLQDIKLAKLTLKTIPQARTGIKWLVGSYYSNFITQVDYRKFLYVIVKDFKVLDKFEGYVHSFNGFWFSILLKRLHSAETVNDYVKSTFIMVDSKKRVKLSDVFYYVSRWGELEQLFTNENYRAQVLIGGNGTIVYPANQMGVVKNLLEYSNQIKNSVEYWASNGTEVQKILQESTINVERFYLFLLLKRLGTCSPILKEYLNCPINEYLLVDRCFGYALQICPALIPVLGSKYAKLVLRCMVPHVHLKDNNKFVNAFLRSLLSQLGKLRFHSRSDLTEDEYIQVVSGGISHEITINSFLLGLEGLIELFKSANFVELAVKIGKLSVEIV